MLVIAHEDRIGNLRDSHPKPLINIGNLKLQMRTIRIYNRIWQSRLFVAHDENTSVTHGHPYEGRVGLRDGDGPYPRATRGAAPHFATP